VIITAEEIVDGRLSRGNRAHGHSDYLVEAVVHLRSGLIRRTATSIMIATSLISITMLKSTDGAGFRKYLEENVLGVKSFDEYLDKWIDIDKLKKIKADPSWILAGR